MCCGTAKNSYATLDSMRVIFADGSILDTFNDNSVADFRKINKDFINVILNIRQQITQSQEMVDFIKKKFCNKKY